MSESPRKASEEAPPPFSERVRDPRPDVRLSALGELFKPEAKLPTASEVAPCVEDSEVHVRQLAVVLLARIGEPGVPALARALAKEQPVLVRTFAASGLAQMGRGAAPAAEALGRALGDPDDRLRWNAAFALGKIGRGAIPVLRSALRSSELPMQRAAVDGLGYVGREAREAVEDIRRIQESPSPTLRVACAAALVKITGDPGAGLPLMTANLKGSDAQVRAETLERLGELREAGRSAAPHVFRCAEDHAAPVRAAAALTLVKIGADVPQTVASLTRLLSDSDATVRGNAGIGLHAIGPPAASALPSLRPLEKDADPRVAAIAKAAADKIEGKEPPPAPPVA